MSKYELIINIVIIYAKSGLFGLKIMCRKCLNIRAIMTSFRSAFSLSIVLPEVKNTKSYIVICTITFFVCFVFANITYSKC